MGRIERVIDRMYCGGSMNDQATVHDTIRRHGITHILNLDKRCDYEKCYGTEFEGIDILHYHIDDDGTQRPDRWIMACLFYCLDVLSDPSNVLFVHCAAGRGRSVSACYGVLRALGYSPEDSLRLLIEYSERLSCRDSNCEPIKKARYARDIEPFLVRYGDTFTTLAASVPR